MTDKVQDHLTPSGVTVRLTDVDAALEEQLRSNRQRREKAHAEVVGARRELQKLLVRGTKRGVDVAGMARVAGISRDTAHRLLRQARA